MPSSPLWNMSVVHLKLLVKLLASGLKIRMVNFPSHRLSASWGTECTGIPGTMMLWITYLRFQAQAQKV